MCVCVYALCACVCVCEPCSLSSSQNCRKLWAFSRLLLNEVNPKMSTLVYNYPLCFYPSLLCFSPPTLPPLLLRPPLAASFQTSHPSSQFVLLPHSLFLSPSVLRACDALSKSWFIVWVLSIGFCIKDYNSLQQPPFNTLNAQNKNTLSPAARLRVSSGSRKTVVKTSDLSDDPGAPSTNHQLP